jgi:hypothetical protein
MYSSTFAPRPSERVFHESERIGRLGQRVELQRDADQALEECVVDFTADAHAFPEHE